MIYKKERRDTVMKKFIGFLLSIAICFAISPNFVNFNAVMAQENNTFVENLDDEITPEQEMVEMGNELDMDVYAFQTTKEIPSVQTYSLTGNDCKRYEMTTDYYFVDRDATNGYMYKQDSIAIVGAAAHINISVAYDYYVQNNFEYSKFVSTSGSVTNFNSGFSFVRAEVKYGSSGPQYPGQAIYTVSYSPSWYYSGPTNWGYNILGSGGTFIGSNATVYITRDGSNIYSGYLNVTVS